MREEELQKKEKVQLSHWHHVAMAFWGVGGHCEGACANCEQADLSSPLTTSSRCSNPIQQ